MDKSGKMTCAMIEAAVDKGLRDIEENPRRGIRNLVDLGTQLSTSRFHKDFFRTSQQMLRNENSPYYELTNHIVRNVNHQIIKHFGISLGYTSLTYGAQRIREYEKEYGYNIPWTIVFDFREDTKNMLSDAEISEVLLYGESIGIYCGMFFVNKNQAHLENLVKMLASHKDSAFLVFTEPQIITDVIADVIVESSNILVALSSQTGGEKQSFMEAAQILFDKKCLYGAYCGYNDHNLQEVIGETYSRQIKEARCTFTFLIREEFNNAQNEKRFSHFMQATKSANKDPFFWIDFYEDLAHVDRTISVEDCFLAIQGDGQIAVKTLAALQEGINIRTHSLQTIMEKTMPKTQFI